MNFSVQELEEILSDCDRKVINYSIAPFSDDVKGFTTKHLSLAIECDSADTTAESKRYFFVKALTDDLTENQVGMCRALDAFRKEIFFYRFLMPECERLGCDVAIAPSCRLVKGGGTLVFDDLTKTGFQTPQDGPFLTREMCQSALKTMAKLHAASLKLDHAMNGRLYDQHTDLLKDRVFVQEADNKSTQFVETVRDVICQMVDRSPELSFGVPNDRLKHQIVLTLKTIYAQAKPSQKYPNVCLHGDLWANNIMFCRKSSGSLDCRFVDFQFLRYTLPALDFLYFLFTNTPSHTFCYQHLTDFADLYMRELSQHLTKYGLDAGKIYTPPDFRESWRAAVTTAKYQSMMGRLLFHLPSDVEGSPGVGDELLLHDNGSFILEVFDKRSDYRDFMRGEIADLKRIIFDEIEHFQLPSKQE